MASVTTTSAISPELEVSFLGRIPEDRFACAQKVRLPSFARKDYLPATLFSKIWHQQGDLPFNSLDI